MVLIDLLENIDIINRVYRYLLHIIVFFIGISIIANIISK